jgi:3-isopropylmalate/(R)-2-methylmalate dehydratase large subunit
MTQTLWRRKPKRMRITIDGALRPHISAKDLALHVIATIGTGGAQGHAVEYAGAAISALSMEGRLTLCNMSIEAGARCALVAPDDKTFAFVRGRRYAPSDAMLERAIASWRGLVSDADAVFDRDLVIDGAAVAPTVTWGVSPEDALPVTARTPAPSRADAARATAISDALDYMGLEPDMPLTEIAIDRVFIGSCTNGRLEDLRAAAAVLRGRISRVPGLVSPGSSAVKRQAEAEGLDRIFKAAGLDWADSGCSMCVGMNGDRVGAGERCASTTNRNFRGRQGIGARTHLMSPAMVAAAAVTGRITDVRTLAEG